MSEKEILAVDNEKLDKESLDLHSELSPENPEKTNKDTDLGDKTEKKVIREPYESLLFTPLQKELEEIKAVEDKLERLFVFMKESLNSRKVVNLKDFWEARKICFNLLKEKIKHEVRNQFWLQYKDLTQEALQLKDILDEQNNFASEQIDLAIASLEKEISSIETLVKSDVGLSKTFFPDFLGDDFEYYNLSQSKLNILNAFASKVNSLRKELIKTEMRIRKKNDFFQRLSQVGDSVFPKRKDLIKGISERFQGSVTSFVNSVSKENLANEPLFRTRDGIKMLQGLAKALTLNTAAFNVTRIGLSKVWDTLKDLEKVRKKDRFEKREKMKGVFKAIEEKFEVFKKEYEENPFSLDVANKKINELADEFESLDADMDREDWRWFKTETSKLKRPIFDKQRKEEGEKKEIAKIEEGKRKELLNTFIQKIETLLEEIPNKKTAVILEEKEALLKELKILKATKIEKQGIERIIRKVKDKITEKKENEVLNLPPGDKEALGQLLELLEEKKKRRVEVKDNVKSLRLASGGSCLDFQKALEFDEQLQIEKETLSTLEKSIGEVEKKIKEIKE
jgi:hypothetical protein